MEYLFKRNSFKVVIFTVLTLNLLLSNSVSSYAETGAKKRHLSLSIKDAVSLALKNNKDILIQKNEIRVIKGQILKARGEFLPKINVNASYTHRDAVMQLGAAQSNSSDKDSGVFLGYENENKLGVAVKQPIFEGDKNTATLKQTKLRLKLQKEKLRALRLSVEFEVQRLYYGILLACDVERITQDLLNQAKSHYEIVKKKFEQGAASKFELLQSKVQVSKVIPELVKAENTKKTLMSEFKKVLGVNEKDSVVLKGKLTYSFIDANEKKFLSIAYKKNPELIIHSLEINIEKQGILVAKSLGKPHINANLNYDYKSNNIGNMFNPKHNNWNIGVTINFPLFDGFSAKAKLNEAKARYRQTELSKEDIKDNITLKVRKGTLDLIRAQAIIKSQRDSLQEAKEAVKIAEVRYSNGTGTNLDVLDAQVSLSQIEKNLSQAIYDYIMAKAYLNRVIGVSLFIGGKDEK